VFRVAEDAQRDRAAAMRPGRVPEMLEKPGGTRAVAVAADRAGRRHEQDPFALGKSGRASSSEPASLMGSCCRNRGRVGRGSREGWWGLRKPGRPATEAPTEIPVCLSHPTSFPRDRSHFHRMKIGTVPCLRVHQKNPSRWRRACLGSRRARLSFLRRGNVGQPERHLAPAACRCPAESSALGTGRKRSAGRLAR